MKVCKAAFREIGAGKLLRVWKKELRRLEEEASDELETEAVEGNLEEDLKEA